MGIFIDQEESQKRLIALINKHETLGELSILAGEARSASVVALRDSQLLRIGRAEFDELIKKHPSITVPMSRILAERLRESTANRALRLRPKVLTFIAASPSIDIVQIANRLAKTVTADCGETVHVQESNADNWSNEKLSQLENEFDLIFLCCRLGDEEWMRSCARQKLLPMKFQEAFWKSSTIIRWLIFSYCMMIRMSVQSQRRRISTRLMSIVISILENP